MIVMLSLKPVPVRVTLVRAKYTDRADLKTISEKGTSLRIILQKLHVTTGRERPQNFVSN